LIKKDINKDYGELNVVCNVLGSPALSGYPREFITKVDDKGEWSNAENLNDDEEGN
jgi:hypothetical protein